MADDNLGHNSGMGPDEMDELRKTVHAVEALILQKLSVEEEIKDIYDNIKERADDDRTSLQVSGIKNAIKERAAYRKDPEKYRARADLLESYLAAIPKSGVDNPVQPGRIEDDDQAKLEPYRPAAAPVAADAPATAQETAFLDAAKQVQNVVIDALDAVVDAGPAIQVPDDEPEHVGLTDAIQGEHVELIVIDEIIDDEPLDDDSQGTDASFVDPNPMEKVGDDNLDGDVINGILYEDGTGGEQFCAIIDPKYAEVSAYVVASARQHPDGTIERIEDAEPDAGEAKVVTIADLPSGGRLDGVNMYDAEGELVGTLAKSVGAAVTAAEDLLAIPPFLKR
jgi:hypothetical protein